MVRLEWRDFLAVSPEAHCITLEIPPDAAVELRSILETMKRLLRQSLKPEGAHALQLARATGAPLIQCAFALRADADRLAVLVGAADASVDRWASHRLRSLDDGLYLRIYEQAGPPDTRRQRRRADAREAAARDALRWGSTW